MRPISTHELNHQLGNGDQWVLVDVRDAASFRDGHIPEAVNVPWGPLFAQCFEQVVEDKYLPVAVYGSDLHCAEVRQVARTLDSLGYTRIYAYLPGLTDWQAVGLPLELGEMAVTAC